MKDEGSNSMIISFKQKLQQNDLPSIGHLMDTTPKKDWVEKYWKKQVMKAAKQYMENLAEERSNLKYLNQILKPATHHSQSSHKSPAGYPIKHQSLACHQHLPTAECSTYFEKSR